MAEQGHILQDSIQSYLLFCHPDLDQLFDTSVISYPFQKPHFSLTLSRFVIPVILYCYHIRNKTKFLRWGGYDANIVVKGSEQATHFKIQDEPGRKNEDC